MFCGKCGTQNSDNSSFCGKCGAKLEPIIATANNLSGRNTSDISGVSTNGMLNKKIMVAVVLIVAVAVGAFFVLHSSGSALIGTWEERSFDTGFRTITYDPGEGDKFTLGKNGVIIDSDYFFGYEFAYVGAVDVTSWSVEGNTLILHTQYGGVEYVPYKLSGKSLTLYFSDERSAVMYKVK